MTSISAFSGFLSGYEKVKQSIEDLRPIPERLPLEKKRIIDWSFYLFVPFSVVCVVAAVAAAILQFIPFAVGVGAAACLLGLASFRVYRLSCYKSIEETTEQLEQIVEDLYRLLRERERKIQEIKRILPKIEKYVEGLKKVPEKAEKVFQKGQKTLRNANQQLGKNLAKFQNKTEVFREIADKMDDFQDASGKFVVSVESLGENTKLLQTLLDGLKSNVQGSNVQKLNQLETLIQEQSQQMKILVDELNRVQKSLESNTLDSIEQKVSDFRKQLANMNQKLEAKLQKQNREKK